MWTLAMRNMAETAGQRARERGDARAASNVDPDFTLAWAETAGPVDEAWERLRAIDEMLGYCQEYIDWYKSREKKGRWERRL